MKKYEVCVHVQVDKILIVEAQDEDDAVAVAYDVCENTDIPVAPEDEPDVWIEDVLEISDEILT